MASSSSAPNAPSHTAKGPRVAGAETALGVGVMPVSIPSGPPAKTEQGKGVRHPLFPVRPTFHKAIGRRERIRTSGPYVPNVVLYQAELLSDKRPKYALGRRRRRRERPYSDASPPPQPARKPLSGRRFSRFAALGRAGYRGAAPAGASPSGKALDFDSSIRRFDP